MNNLERKEIKLTNAQFKDLIYEDGYETEDGEWVEFIEVKHGIDGSSRHTTHEYKIFESIDNEFFIAHYETSNKDSMGWIECNYEDYYTITQVFPKEITTIIYE